MRTFNTLFKISLFRSVIIGFCVFFSLFLSTNLHAVTRNAGTEAAFLSAYSSSATSNDVISLTNNIVVTSELLLDKNITINGNGYTISVPNPGLDDMGKFTAGASAFRVFTINTAKEVILNNMTIKGGNINDGHGGAIQVLSTAILHLNSCIISNSRNSYYIGGGGGIFNRGVVYLSNSMISRNAASFGGGVFNGSAGVVYIENSTFSDNRSTSSAGGGGAIENQGLLYINNSSISNNQSTEIGGGINNVGGTIYIVNSSVTGNVAYGSSSFTGGGIGNNNGTVHAVNTLFAHNYHIFNGSAYLTGLFELDDIKAYRFQERVYLYYCVFHADLPIGTNNVIGNKQYTGLQNGSDNTIFSGGSLSKISDGTGAEIGTATLFRPFLYNNNVSVAPTIKIGSYLLQTANKGTQTRFSNNNNVNPAIAYYNKTSGTWVDLLNVSTSGQLITSDQISAARANPPVVGAIETATAENLYMVKVNTTSTGTVNGGTFFGDVYAAGSSVTLTAIPNTGYHFVRWDYVGGIGGTGTASTANPYTFTVNNDITLVPIFAANVSSYTITYIGNENTSGDAPATTSYTAPTTILPTGTLARMGYTIEGWNTNANGSGTDYAVGSTYSAGANLTLYAKWTKNIAIVPNAATNIRLRTATLGATITPPEAVVTDRGICWSTSPNVTISNNKTSAGGTTGGTFSVNVSGLPRSSTIYFKGYVSSTAGTVLSDELNFSNVPIFTGTGYWDDAERWNVQEVPGYSGETGLDNPIINGICTMADTNPIFWICSNLTINANAKLTINPSQTLIVAGTITNHAEAPGLVIKSNSTQPNATLYFESGTPKATVEMYSKAFWDLNKPTGSKYSWQFFGIPVKTLSYSNAFSNCFVRKHNETSESHENLWVMQGSGSVLTSGTGYEIVQQSPKTYQFVGELTNEDFMRTLPHTSSSVFPGQHIFANPYTAAIDIRSIQFGTNTEQSVYLFNTGTYNQWLNEAGVNYANTSTAAGQYTVSTINTLGQLGVPEQIPSMQGFLVKTLNNLPGSINIPYLTSVKIGFEMQRANRNATTTPASEKVVTRIDLKANHFADCVWIFSDSACTRKFDNGWDGYKMKGSPSNLQLYATEADGDYQINAVDDINGTYLSFQAGQDTVFTLTFTNKNLEMRYAGIYLVDLLTNQITDVSASGSVYHFKAFSTPEPIVRFKIVTKPTAISTANAKVLKVFSTKEVLLIDNQTSFAGNYELYNISGSIVKNGAFATNGITTISTKGLPTGTYIVKAITENDKVIEKVIVH